MYHLSTVEDVGSLEAPVVLTAPQLADRIVVAELQDGEWRTVSLSTGTTTTVNLDHFSSNYRAFLNCGLIVLGLADFDNKASLNITALAGLVCGAITPVDEDDDDDDSFGDEPAFDPAPTLNPEDQAFVNSVLDDVVNELERAKASNETIAATKASVRVCLTNALLTGDTHSSASGKCDPDPGSSPAPDPDADPDCPVTGSAAPCDPEDEPEPGQTSTPTPKPSTDETTPPEATASPTPTPQPTATPEPEVASITIVGHTAERSAEVCKQTSELCTYVVTVSVEFTTSVPSAIFCFQVVDGGSASWGNNTNVASGPGALTVTNNFHSSPPDGPFDIPVSCDLRDISDGLNFAPVIASDSVPLNVTVPPLPD